MSNSVPTQFVEDYQEWVRRARAAEATVDRIDTIVRRAESHWYELDPADLRAALEE